MMDDSLPVLWMSDGPIRKETITTAVQHALEEDRVAREKERSVRAASLVAVALLCPVLAWSAAHGVTPLVRFGYLFMAVGVAIMLTAEWMYLSWARAALPGPVDARSQLQRSAFLLDRQAHLLRTAPLWSAPVLVGAILVVTWVFRERSHTEGYLLWLIVAVAWLGAGFPARSKWAQLDAHRQRIERLLADL